VETDGQGNHFINPATATSHLLSGCFPHLKLPPNLKARGLNKESTHSILPPHKESVKPQRSELKYVYVVMLMANQKAAQPSVVIYTCYLSTLEAEFKATQGFKTLPQQ
jgi:hypothetical protein